MTKESKNNFKLYEQEIKESIAKAKKKLQREKKEHIRLNSYTSEKIKSEIAKVLKAVLKTKKSLPEIELEAPPPYISGDLCMAVFKLAGILKQKPEELAQKISEYINKHNFEFLKEASVIKGFVNINIKKEKAYKEILWKIKGAGERYGESNINSKKTAIIEYSSPNIAKPISVGHLRSTVIGQALVNIYRETGYNITTDNHLGDWGSQFGSLLYTFKKWGKKEKIKKNPIEELKKLYVRFHKFSQENPEAKEEARKLTAKLENKDPELVSLWKRFRDLSLKDFQETYKRLGVQFDTNIGESYFIEQARKITKECSQKKLCRKDKLSQTLIVENLENLPTFLIKTKEGSTLYITRDLATLKLRIKEFSPDVILYVVGGEQELHFKQLFALSKKLGHLPKKVKPIHIGFGMVLNEGKKMSTRRGTVIELKELFSRAVKKSKEIMKKKNPKLSQKELDNLSEIIGIGAVIYNDLSQSRIKDISFDWDKMIDFKGGSAAYLQYTFVRINSILKKLKPSDSKVLNKEEIFFENESEFNLAKKLMFFPQIILRSQKTNFPHHICVYLEELTQLFNNFYDETSVIKTKDSKLRSSRIMLIKSTALVIKRGLSLVNIKVPDKM